MNILKQEIEHLRFGKGKVIGQEAERLSVEFSEQHGTKQFVYPDAFEKYLKMCDPKIQLAVQEELHAKQTQLEAEKARKYQEYETSKNLEKLEHIAQKRKPSSKSGASKAKKKNTDVPAKTEDAKQDSLSAPR